MSVAKKNTHHVGCRPGPANAVDIFPAMNSHILDKPIVLSLNRAWQVKAEVREEWLHSNIPGADYAATVALLGLRWQP